MSNNITDLSRVNVGDSIPEVVKNIDQEKIVKYAHAAGDMNPLHIDPEFAKNTIFKGTIAHGLMGVGFISEMMTSWAGKLWLSGSKLEVSFLSPVRPGDTVTVKGKVVDKSTTGGRNNLVCEIICENQSGQKVIAGRAYLSG